MTRRTTLFVITAETTDDEITKVAEASAAREDHLRCLLLGAVPSLPLYAYGMPSYGLVTVPDGWTELVADSREKLEARTQEIETLLAQSGVSGEIDTAHCRLVEVKHHVARAALVSDEAIFSTTLRETSDFMREAAYGVLFDSPIGLRLNEKDQGDYSRIFVAWDGSHAASSAVHAALPHLKKTDEVLIGCIDPDMSTLHDSQNPGTDIAAWLSHHGCNVTVSQYPSGGLEVADCIRNRAREFGADLIVMGAYGHARMVQAVFGGTTLSMLEQTETPVLMAH